MKIKLFIIELLLSIICCLNMTAQNSSTEANPKWFYIQVKGIALTADWVLTDADGQVKGQPLAITGIDAINKQLWRFEIPDGVNAYRIINKHSKKQLTVVLDGNLRRPALTENSPVYWSFSTSPTSGYKYLKVYNEPVEGTAGDIYLFQGRYNTYTLVSERSLGTGTFNELFRCASNEIPVPSTGNTTLWMHIRNPKTNKYLTDAVSIAPGKNFTMETQNISLSQQWKMIAKGNGNVEFVNRATGNIISTTANLNRYYFLDYTGNPAESNGWKYAAISAASNQYEIFTTSADGAISYWNATTEGEAPATYSAGNTANTTYAWAFSWVDEVYTAIEQPEVLDNTRVYVRNRRIYVEGCDEYRITSISGMQVRKNIELPSGIYLVTTKAKTTKILVK
jgi:hypothetical protein